MRTFALIVLLLLCSSAFPQVDFQVRKLDFVHADSIMLLVDHPNGNEVLRVYANSFPNGELQRGLIRERGDKVEFPAGERFFCMDGSDLITESYNQSRQKANVQALRLRRYLLNKSRISKTDELVDSLQGLAAPLWRRWNNQFLVHPACKNVDIHQNTVILGSQRSGAVYLQAFSQNTRLPFLNKSLPPRPGMQLAGEPWLRPLIATPDVWLLQSWWQSGFTKPQAWLTAIDSTGTVLWDEKAKGDLVDHFHPLGLVLLQKEHELLGQQLEAIDSRTGTTIWTSPLFDLYSNDSLLSWSAPAPGHVAVLDVAPVLGGAYTAVIMVQKDGEKPLLLLLDDQGKLVYRYAVDGPVRLGRLQDRDTGFALVTERGSMLFRPK
ncbi:MAG: hypothetical protein R3B47_03600 [Bacteroidia bacterium]